MRWTSTLVQKQPQIFRASDFTTICRLLLLIFLLKFLLLIQVNVRRLHPNDGFVQEAESFLYMFWLHLRAKKENLIVLHTLSLFWDLKIIYYVRFR